jgi:hypothetical protein
MSFLGHFVDYVEPMLCLSVICVELLEGHIWFYRIFIFGLFLMVQEYACETDEAYEVCGNACLLPYVLVENDCVC